MKSVVALSALLIGSNVWATNALEMGNVVFCKQVDGPRSYEIKITKIDSSTHEGEATVVAKNEEATRRFSGANARYEEYQDRLGVELRSNGRIVEFLRFFDSVRFRPVSGDVTFNNGHSAPLKCHLVE